MARHPNYNFERKERERLKAEKKAKRADEKREAREKKSGQSDPSVQIDSQHPKLSTAE
jgi:hypothetical protein